MYTLEKIFNAKMQRENIDNPDNFDIVINTDEVTLDEAVAMIVWLEKRKMKDTKEHK